MSVSLPLTGYRPVADPATVFGSWPGGVRAHDRSASEAELKKDNASQVVSRIDCIRK